MISLHFTTRLPGFTLEAECDLPGDGFTAVLGPSGCGKSTLAGGIAGLVKPASGTISFNGCVFMSDDPCIDLPVESRGIGFVFQSHRLFPHLTVRENLLFGRRFGGRRTAVDQDRLIEVLGIAYLLSRRPDTLSGAPFSPPRRSSSWTSRSRVSTRSARPSFSATSSAFPKSRAFTSSTSRTPPTRPRGSRRPSSR